MGTHVSEHPMMSSPSPHHRRTPIAGILLSAIVAGFGIFLIIQYLLFFNWLYFVGVPITIGGAVIFFRSLTGPDAADE